MGRGDRFSLKFKLESTKTLDARRLSQLQKPIETLARLQRDLNRGENQQTKPELSDKQLKTAAAVLELLVGETEQTPFARYVSVIRRDVKSQQLRVRDVGGLAKKFVGARAPKLMLKTLSGKVVNPTDNAGKIVVLHFWEYRGKPLEEPYGQVGYLDFLNNKNRKRKFNVNIYGVAVDKRLAVAATRSAALRSVRDLQKFFNLSYPITLDDGTLLGKFGDPRRLDAKLPLWVVIAADGKIAHYSTGFYNIKPDEGLKQLEAVIVRLVKEQRSGGK
jgi:peroxiredoxin